MTKSGALRYPHDVKPESVDAYLATLDEEVRAALQKLREDIAAAAPDAVECISYGLPAFREGRLLVGFGAAKGHCALYLMSSRTTAQFEEELAGYDTGKGTVRFKPAAPLPRGLVSALVCARREENAAKSAK